MRDGDRERPGVPKRKAIHRSVESLAGDGYGSFRYDQVNHVNLFAAPNIHYRYFFVVRIGNS